MRVFDCDTYEVWEIPDEIKEARGVFELRSADGFVMAVEPWRITHAQPGQLLLAPASTDPKCPPAMMFLIGAQAPEVYSMRRILVLPETDDEVRRLGMTLNLTYVCDLCRVASVINLYLLDWLEFWWKGERSFAETFPYLKADAESLIMRKLCAGCDDKVLDAEIIDGG